MHLHRWRKWGDPRPDIPSRRTVRRSCEAEGCEEIHYALGYCRAHHRRFKRYGDPFGLSDWAKGNRQASEAFQARKRKPGAKYVGKAPGGYTYVFAPDSEMANGRGLVLEHRLVMSEVLGRPLLPSETVHHVNGVKVDNRPENLELWSTVHKPGQRARDLVELAYEILERYESDYKRGVL